MTPIIRTASPVWFDHSVGDRRRAAVRRFIEKLLGGRTYQVEGEITDYLQRHQHDLPPELRMMLERRFLGP